ncbi:hypothetical protein [Clostridium paridis]|uniref:Uncharacterized protein n=1 Tax=Clostridium paridis TaxID=2803863 RepID=A0A937FFJ2_9CLOT|nr:hypothetical protein [Clostridium paridis]MBL4932258.1 hypothetical protein [Clostridium paridis]
MLYNDISDSYKSRDYIIEYTLQKENFKGHIYINYNYNGFGLTEDCFSDFKFIHEFNELDNDCKFKVCGDKKTVRFILHNNEGKSLEVIEDAENLRNYLVGVNIVSCEGHGKKKEKRKCNSCSNFIIKTTNETIKGFCKIKKELGIIYGSRVICAFDYRETKEDINKV